MESQASAHRPRSSIPETLAFTTTVLALVGVGFLLAVIGLALVDKAIDITPSVLRFLTGLGLIISVPLVFLAAPSLAWLLGMTVRDRWEAIVEPEEMPRDDQALRRLARRLLTTAVLLGLVSGPPAIAAVLAGHSLHFAFPGGISFLLVIPALVAAYLGYVTAKLSGQLPGRTGLPRIVALVIIPFGVIVPASHLPIGSYAYHLRDQAGYARKTPTFDGNSTALTQTTIVPTLDSPCPPNRNVIWCSSFQLAWNELRDNAVGAPLEVAGAEPIAKRLNTAPQSIGDLEPNSVYAAAGRIEQGIVDTIRLDMNARFPEHPLPDFNDYDDPEGILAYAYLTAQVPFKYPFRQVEEAFTFCDSRGHETDVQAFGLWQAHLKQYQNMREQVEILFCRSNDPNRGWEVDEYALDLCRHSAPYQVVVAVVEPHASLAETYNYVQAWIAEFGQRDYYEQEKKLGKADILKVPEMFWEIDHHFEELIGKMVVNPNVGMPILEAMQTIRFRLDRSGAMLESEAMSYIASIPRHFEFNRPFLVYLQKRGAEQPFFVMWVDNAELLVSR